MSDITLNPLSGEVRDPRSARRSGAAPAGDGFDRALDAALVSRTLTGWRGTAQSRGSAFGLSGYSGSAPRQVVVEGQVVAQRQVVVEGQVVADRHALVGQQAALRRSSSDESSADVAAGRGTDDGSAPTFSAAALPIDPSIAAQVMAQASV
ncbi:MAG: hypothetical protein Q4P32_06055, partial [Micrococcales bacterium]|nr:hypothetical protein [Micrococcales bacterium]